MKSRKLMCITAMTLFAVLAMPVRMPAQGTTAKFRHYKLIDIGTFGGPASYVNPAFTFGSPDQINGRGTTVGVAATSIPTTATSDFFVCGGLDGKVPFVFHALEWRKGPATDLGALPPANENCSNATSINAKGDIVGTSENGDIDPVLGVTQLRAVRWKDGVIEDLGTFGGTRSAASAINNRGQIVGCATNAIPDPFSYLDLQLGGSSQGTQTRAFLWQNGAKQELGTLGGPDSCGLLLNEAGQVAGQSYINSTANATTGFPTQDPFLWQSGRMIDLGTLGGTNGGPAALNNAGQVIGISNLAGDQLADPFLWSRGRLIDLFTTTIGGNPVTANAISDAAEIVGTAVFADRPIADAYLWKNGVAKDLGAVADDCFSEAFAINSQAQVVGQSFSCVSNTFRAFLWEKESIVDLNSLIPDSSLQLAWALAINARGEIGGVANPPDCQDYTACGHAFVLIPICADGSEGCADAPFDRALVTRSRAVSGAPPKTMTAEELATFKKRMARMAGRNRGFGLWPQR